THTTQPVSGQEFLEAAGPQARELAAAWLSAPEIPADAGGPSYLLSSIRRASGVPGHTLIVYGTVTEAGANRFAAEQLQKKLLDWHETAPAIRRDFELTDEELRDDNVIFIGRPETNSAVAAIAKEIGIDWNGGDFTMQGAHHASEREALALAAANPRNARRMVLLLSGNCALETVRLGRGADALSADSQFAIYDFGKKSDSGFLR